MRWFVEGHAAVHDHRRAPGASRARFQDVKHIRERGAIGAMAVEDLVGLREPFSIQNQPDHDLLAVRSAVPRVAALRLRVVRAWPLEVRGGQVVEVHALVQIEQRSLTLGEAVLDEGAPRV